MTQQVLQNAQGAWSSAAEARRGHPESQRHFKHQSVAHTASDTLHGHVEHHAKSSDDEQKQSKTGQLFRSSRRQLHSPLSALFTCRPPECTSVFVRRDNSQYSGCALSTRTSPQPPHTPAAAEQRVSLLLTLTNGRVNEWLSQTVGEEGSDLSTPSKTARNTDAGQHTHTHAHTHTDALDSKVLQNQPGCSSCSCSPWGTPTD